MSKYLLLLWTALLPAQPQPAKPADAKKADEPTTLAATITLRDVDLKELLAKLKENENTKLDLGYAVGGKVTVVANISVPLGDATSSKAYTVRGKVTSPELTLEGLRLKDLAADVVYADGKLTLSALKASLPPDAPGDKPGTISGTASAAITPRGDLTAKLTLTSVPLGEALKAVPGGVAITGAVSGSAEFNSPVDELRDPAKWVASADLSSSSLVAFGRTATDTKAKVAVKGGKVTLTELSGVVEGLPLTGDGTLTLSDKYPYTAAVRTKPKETSDLSKLVPELGLGVAVRGKLAADAKVDGTLTPPTASASGTVTATDFAVGDSAADTLTAKWTLSPERVTVTGLKAGIFKGSVSGSADVPLVPEKAGDFKLKFDEVDAGAVAAAFPKVPVKLTGQVSGDVAGTLPAAKPDRPRDVTADVNLTAPKLTVQGIPAEKLTGKLALDGSAVKYELEGKTLGGSFEVKGRYPSAEQEKQKPEEKKEQDGSIVLRGIDLNRLTEALRLKGVQLRGVVDFTFRHSADLTEGDGRYSVRGFGLGRDQLIPEISGRVRLRKGTIELVDTVGPVTGGTVRARVQASLSEPARNFYRLHVDRLDVRSLLGGSSRTQWLDGGVSLSARGRLYPEFTAEGTVGLSRGRLGGLSVTDLRLPYTLTVRSGGGQLRVREASGVVGDGRVSGQFEYGWGANGRVSGQVKFTNVRVGSVLADLKQTNYFGQARVTGRIDLGGENVHSVDDLTASVTAALQQAAVRDLPVLDTIIPFPPQTVVLKPFDSGDLRGRLSRGVFRIERLTLSSPNADLYADGSVTTAGRLDLGVIVRTGNIGLNDALLRQLGLAILPVGPLPLEVIRDVSAFLSNRTVRLNVTGTIANPRPEVNTAALIADEAVRFLLRRYLPTAAAVLPEISPRTTR